MLGTHYSMYLTYSLDSTLYKGFDMISNIVNGLYFKSHIMKTFCSVNYYKLLSTLISISCLIELSNIFQNTIKIKYFEIQNIINHQLIKFFMLRLLHYMCDFINTVHAIHMYICCTYVRMYCHNITGPGINGPRGPFMITLVLCNNRNGLPGPLMHRHKWSG